MFILILIKFVLSTLYWAAWMAASVIQVHSVLVTNIDMLLCENRNLTNEAVYLPQLVLVYLGSFQVLPFNLVLLLT